MSISPLQIAVILLILLLVFGAKRLPQLGRSLGEALRNFKKGLEGGNSALTSKDDDSKKDDSA